MRIWSQHPFTWELSLLLEMLHYSSPDPGESCWLELLAFKTCKFDRQFESFATSPAAINSALQHQVLNKKQKKTNEKIPQEKKILLLLSFVNTFLNFAFYFNWMNSFKSCDSNVYTMCWLLQSCHRRVHSSNLWLPQSFCFLSSRFWALEGLGGDGIEVLFGAKHSGVNQGDLHVSSSWSCRSLQWVSRDAVTPLKVHLVVGFTSHRNQYYTNWTPKRQIFRNSLCG